MPRFNLVLLMGSLIACAGCSRGDWGTVSGKVSLDGRPLEKGMVTFNPSAGGAAGYGQVSGGAFTIQTGTAPGVKVGPYKVTVVDEMIPEDYQPVKILTPAKYANLATTDFQVEVKPGVNDVTLQMKTK